MNNTVTGAIYKPVLKYWKAAKFFSCHRAPFSDVNYFANFFVQRIFGNPKNYFYTIFFNLKWSLFNEAHGTIDQPFDQEERLVIGCR